MTLTFRTRSGRVLVRSLGQFGRVVLLHLDKFELTDGRQVIGFEDVQSKHASGDRRKRNLLSPSKCFAGSDGLPRAVLLRLEILRQAGVPVVLLDRDLQSFPKRSDFDLVGIDNVAGGYLLAEHLLKLGCERLYFVARPLSAPTVDARIAGAREVLVRRRIELAPDWVRLGDPADLKFVRSLTPGKQADAFICAYDHTAAALLCVPLTTIHQPCRDIAVVAFRTMLQRIAEPTLPARSLALTPTLVVRETCGACLTGVECGNPLSMCLRVSNDRLCLCN